ARRATSAPHRANHKSRAGDRFPDPVVPHESSVAMARGWDGELATSVGAADLESIGAGSSVSTSSEARGRSGETPVRPLSRGALPRLARSACTRDGAGAIGARASARSPTEL